MSKKYCFVVYGKDFSRVTLEEIEQIKKNFKRIHQGGFAYGLDNKSVIFTSHTLADIHEIEKNRGWAHSLNASRVQKGFTVYVIPNSKLIKNHELTAFGIKFTAFTDIEYIEDNELIWTSETMNRVVQKQVLQANQ